MPGTAPMPWLRTAAAQAHDVVDQLLAQARGWLAKGRMDKAVEAYRKLLRSKPDHPEALEAIGTWHAHAGRAGPARQRLRRLERAAPGSDGARRLRAALEVGERFDTLLGQARAEVRAGHLERAARRYDQAFGGAPPPTHLALEHYQTLGGTPGGWEKARAGLAALARAHPRSRTFALALAKHLTYREHTRREGIAALQTLAQHRATRDAAIAAWRQALLWLDMSAADETRVRAYLAEVGSDAAVAAKLDATLAGRSERARGRHLKAGFDALEHDDADAATRHFEQAGNGPEARVGLALVAMQQEAFERAVKLLEAARRGAPDRPALWSRSLRSARFWSRLKQAEAVTAHDPARAQRLLHEAMKISPDEAHHARLALARLHREAGELAAAQRQLERALAAEPDQPPALRALVDVLLARGQLQDALDANARLASLAPDVAWSKHELDAEVLRHRAATQRRNEDGQTALALLEQAHALAPEHYWSAYDLATLQLELGDLSAARETLDVLMAIDAERPEGRVLRARLLAARDRLEAAVETLRSLPPDASPEAQALHDQLVLRLDVKRILRARERHGAAATRRALLRVEQRAAGDPDQLGIVALAWADAGESDRAARLVQRIAGAQADPPPGLRLQMAAVYLRAGMHDDLERVLDSLLAQEDRLPTAARRDLARLRAAYAVSTADALAADGHYGRALAPIEAQLIQHPDDPELWTALGRLLAKAGEHRDALDGFAEALKRQPTHLDAREGAVWAAVTAGEASRARQLVREGLHLHPEHPRMQLIAARQALASGDDATAMDRLTRGRQLARRAAGARPASAAPGAPPLLRRARSKLGRGGASIEDQALDARIDAEIARIEARHRVELQARPKVRRRKGEPGLGELVELSLPVQLGIPLGYTARLELGAEAVRLAAGTAALDRPDVAARFGALGTVAGVTDPRVQEDAGVAVRGALAYGDALRIEVGSTPLGFLHPRVVGLLRLGQRWGALSLSLFGERAPVTDSLLSYAGTTEPLTGETWGAVTRQGGGVDLAIDSEGTLFYLVGGFFHLGGRRVDDNLMLRVASGIRWVLHADAGHEVTLGLGALGMGYAKNLSGFTLGHGGYFSPEAFVRGGVPIGWRYRSEPLHMELSVDPGVNWFRREEAAFHPIDPDLQAARELRMTPATYAADESFGLSVNAGGRLLIGLGPHLELGMEGSLHFADDYEEYRASGLARLRFGR